MIYFIGLGNPTVEYENTRHNIGRDIVLKFQSKNNFPDFEKNKKLNALVSEGKFGKHKVTLILPETFMNDSGKSVKSLITSKKKAMTMTVLYDDLDLPVGALKISFNRSSGGHKGLESIIRTVKTKEFVRLRVGIAPITPSGKIKKVSGDEPVKRHVLTKFKPAEQDKIKKTIKKAVEGMEIIIEEGYLSASNGINNFKV